MTFKEFTNWCNDRAADGRWGFATAVICLEVQRSVRAVPFWRRKRAWEAFVADGLVDKIIEPTNARIREYEANNE